MWHVALNCGNDLGRSRFLWHRQLRDEGKKVNSDINVTPMVDVMLVLLIIFMVVTPMLNNKVNIELPPSAAAAVVMEDASKEDAVVVAVTREGKTFLGGDQISPSELGQRITDKLENKTDKRVYFRGDVRANYGKVMDAIDGIRSAGVSQLGMIAEKPLM